MLHVKTSVFQVTWRNKQQKQGQQLKGRAAHLLGPSARANLGQQLPGRLEESAQLREWREENQNPPQLLDTSSHSLLTCVLKCIKMESSSGDVSAHLTAYHSNPGIKLGAEACMRQPNTSNFLTWLRCQITKKPHRQQQKITHKTLTKTPEQQKPTNKTKHQKKRGWGGEEREKSSYCLKLYENSGRTGN